MNNHHRAAATNYQQLRQGFIATLVVAASVGAYGSVLGLLAAQKVVGMMLVAAGRWLGV